MRASSFNLCILGLAASASVHASNPELCSQGVFAECLDGVSASVTAFDTVRVVGGQQNGLRREEAEQDAHTGLPARGTAAGDATGFSIWAGATRSDYESTVSIAPYEAEQWIVQAGIDRFFTDALLAGLSVAYENTDTSTRYNAGGGEHDGVTIAPYLAWLINDWFSIDAAFGYAQLNNDTHRVHPTGVRHTASFDSDRWFYSVNLNASHSSGAVTWGGSIGVLRAEEDQDGYTETGVGGNARTVPDREYKIVQSSLRGEVAYAAGDLEPYASVTYLRDMSRSAAGGSGLPGAVGTTTPADRDEFEFGVGLRYFGSGDISGSLEILNTSGRAEFDNVTVNAVLRADF